MEKRLGGPGCKCCNEMYDKYEGAAMEKAMEVIAEKLDNPDVLPSSLNGGLCAFRRYRRALAKNAHAMWGKKRVEQWEGDKNYFQRCYESKRHMSFEIAGDHAHEKLFLRCCGA